MPRLPARAVVALLILAAAISALVWPKGEAVPPCPTEDSVSCYWDADTMGNGQGRSYTNDEHGHPTYR